MQIRTYRVPELTESHWSAWSSLQATVDAYRSPYFHPRFTQAVADVREDVEVAVLTLAGEHVGFFPFQRRGRAALPVGGRLSDFHGLLVRPGIPVDVEQMLAACRVKSFAFDHLVTTHQPFSPAGWTMAASPYVDLSRGFAAYRAERLAAGSEELKKCERKARKLEREVGPIEFCLHTDEPRTWDFLFRWKSQQYHDSGYADVFSFPWIVALLRRLNDEQSPEFRTLVSTLSVDSRVVAVHLGMQCRHVFHSWFTAFDREMSKHSPGLLLMYHLLAAAPDAGMTRVDLGKGDERYKQSFATASEPVAEGCVDHRPLARLARRAWQRTRGWVKSSPWLNAAAELPLSVVRPLRQRRSFR